MGEPARRIVSDETREIGFDDLPEPLHDGLEYWLSLKGDRLAPSWQEFDLLGLSPTVIPYVTVVDRVVPLARSVYRFWGTGHVDAKGIDRTGKTLGEHPQGRAEEVLDEYGKVLERGVPVAFRRRIQLPEPRPMLTQMSLRMPLSSNGRTIDRFVSVCGWLSFRDELRQSEQWRQFYTVD